MNIQEEMAKVEAQGETRIKAAIGSFMAEPLTRMALSLIPPGDHQGALRALIEAAVRAGFGYGASFVSQSVGNSMMELITRARKEKNEDRA